VFMTCSPFDTGDPFEPFEPDLDVSFGCTDCGVIGNDDIPVGQTRSPSRGMGLRQW